MTQTAEMLVCDLKAVKYVKYSVFTQKNPKEVFDKALLAALEPIELQNSFLLVLL